MIQLYNTDCYEAIKSLPDNSIDLIVTDPPYLLSGLKSGLKSGFSREKEAKGLKNIYKKLIEIARHTRQGV